jgi:hypothetical protein
MGGCVSSPKDLALNEGAPAPVEEVPPTPKNVEVETEVAQVHFFFYNFSLFNLTRHQRVT